MKISPKATSFLKEKAARLAKKKEAQAGAEQEGGNTKAILSEKKPVKEKKERILRGARKKMGVDEVQREDFKKRSQETQAKRKEARDKKIAQQGDTDKVRGRGGYGGGGKKTVRPSMPKPQEASAPTRPGAEKPGAPGSKPGVRPGPRRPGTEAGPVPQRPEGKPAGPRKNLRARLQDMRTRYGLAPGERPPVGNAPGAVRDRSPENYKKAGPGQRPPMGYTGYGQTPPGERPPMGYMGYGKVPPGARRPVGPMKGEVRTAVIRDGKPVKENSARQAYIERRQAMM
jgi:hypothetical protein